jgi:hypothetical protein
MFSRCLECKILMWNEFKMSKVTTYDQKIWVSIHAYVVEV